MSNEVHISHISGREEGSLDLQHQQMGGGGGGGIALWSCYGICMALYNAGLNSVLAMQCPWIIYTVAGHFNILHAIYAIVYSL